MTLIVDEENGELAVGKERTTVFGAMVDDDAGKSALFVSRQSVP